MTQGGGANKDGMIFSYDISTGTETDLHDFNGTDGRQPYGSLIQARDSLLYGMTGAGGVNDTTNGEKGVGTIFRYNISTDSETVLHSFGSGTDGKIPFSSLIQASNGSLYGMTQYGGAKNNGIIFSYDPLGNTYSDIYEFNDSDGGTPTGDLLELNPNAGINQLSINNNQLSIYPNPTSGQITIKLNGNQNGYTVEVYSVVGEKIYESVLSGLQNTINLNSQPDGMYFIYLKSEEGVEVGKVLLAR
jgi:uncharacterized repeat protein (TIGR03803 family)